MSLKVKLISTISAFILTLSCLLVGVFAAQNVSLNVGGNVSFTASSVYADITGSYVGTKEYPSSEKSLTPISIDADTTDGAVSMPSDWINMPLNFDESGSAITVTIKIHNKAEGRTISVSLTDNTSITNVSVERKYNNSTFSTNTSTQTITGGQTGTFTFTLNLTSQNNDVSGSFDLDLSLSSVSQSTGSGYNVTIINNYSDIYVWTDTTEQTLLGQGKSTVISGNTVSLSYDPEGSVPWSHGTLKSIPLYIEDIAIPIYPDAEGTFFVIEDGENPYGSGSSRNSNYMILNYDLDKDITITIGE